jgi:L-rhamnose-H+ transport protein
MERRPDGHAPGKSLAFGIIMVDTSTLYLGIILAVSSGLLNGTFTLPMRYLGRWSWENVWTIFVVVSCLAMPPVMTLLTVAHPLEVLAAAPARAELIALATGFIWGFGAILFGQGVSAIGISMANTLVLATSATLGSIIPILILAPERFGQPQGQAIILGTVTATLGMGCCGYAGILRERSEKERGGASREMVGTARPFWVGLAICAGAGLISGLFNVGYSLSQGIIASAVHAGNSAFAGSNLIWLLVLGSGALPNLAFCGYLLRKNRSWAKYRQPKVIRLYVLGIIMGLFWGGSIFAYGAAAPKLGKLGPAIGWPISLVVSLVTANFCGFVAGEWKLSSPAARRWMVLGVAILLGSIGILGWSGHLANR